MPAAAVIPAPIAYIKVVAVKKLVVGFQGFVDGLPRGMHCQWGSSFWRPVRGLSCLRARIQIVYFEKIRVFKAGHLP